MLMNCLRHELRARIVKLIWVVNLNLLVEILHFSFAYVIIKFKRVRVRGCFGAPGRVAFEKGEGY